MLKTKRKTHHLYKKVYKNPFLHLLFIFNVKFVHYFKSQLIWGQGPSYVNLFKRIWKSYEITLNQNFE